MGDSGGVRARGKVPFNTEIAELSKTMEKHL